MQTVAYFFFFIGQSHQFGASPKGPGSSRAGDLCAHQSRSLRVGHDESGLVIGVRRIRHVLFCMSLIFPTIFSRSASLAWDRSSKKKASAFIVMAITGGALMPKIMG